jgi:hypothetical protein
MPHIQNRKPSEMMTRTGLSVNRLTKSNGVTVSPRSNALQRAAPQEAALAKATVTATEIIDARADHFSARRDLGGSDIGL